MAWLAPAVASEALPGRGLKCWLAVPRAHLAGLPLAAPVASTQLQTLTDLAAAAGAGTNDSGNCTVGEQASRPDLLAPEEASQQASEGAGSASIGDSGNDIGSSSRSDSGNDSGSTVEVRVCIGNRRLMQEEGVALSPQARPGRAACGRWAGVQLGALLPARLHVFPHTCVAQSPLLLPRGLAGPAVDAAVGAGGGHVRADGGGRLLGAPPAGRLCHHRPAEARGPGRGGGAEVGPPPP